MTGDFALPSLSFVIPHYTNAERTLELARKISESLSGERAEIVIVDDASPDGSAETLKTQCGIEGFNLAVNETNYGFGATVNRGAAISGGEILFVVNSDVEFCGALPPMAVAEESARLLENDKTGAVMPLIFNTALGEVENLNRIWASRGLLWLKRLDETKRFTDYAGRLISREEAQSGDDSYGSGNSIKSVLCGAFFAMRRMDYLRLGGFDTRFSPYYWEDVELSARIEESGKLVFATPASTVLHAHGKSIERVANDQTKWNVMLKNQVAFSRMWGEKYGIEFGGFWLALRGIRAAVRGQFELAGDYFRNVV